MAMLIHRWTPDKFFFVYYNITQNPDSIVYRYITCNSWYMIWAKFAYKNEILAKKRVELDDTRTDVVFLRNKVCLSPVSRARSKVVIITVSIDGCN